MLYFGSREGDQEPPRHHTGDDSGTWNSASHLILSWDDGHAHSAVHESEPSWIVTLSDVLFRIVRPGVFLPYYCRRGNSGVGLFPVAIVVIENATDIGAGLREWRNAAVFGHGLLPCVVGGKGKRKISSVCIDQVAEVPDASVDVGLGLEAVPDLQGRGRLRHELHEALGSLDGDGFVVEVGLGLDDGLDQRVVYLVTVGGRLDEGVIFYVPRARLEEDPAFTDPDLESPVVGDVGEMYRALFVDVAIYVGPGVQREQKAQARQADDAGKDRAVSMKSNGK
jgi:hypothetical protein